MFNLVSLLVAAALVSLQCGFEAHAQIEGKNVLDNNLQPNVPTPKRRILKPFVNILDAPPESVRLAPGTRVELTCEAIGKPAPTVQWLKNGQLLDEYDEINEIVNVHPSSLGRLTSKVVVSSAANGDEYTCLATAGNKQYSASTNVYTGDDAESNLFALEALFRKPSKPIITDYYNEVFQDMGTTVVLPCRHISAGKAQVYWMDSEDELIYESSRIRVLPSGDLLISGLRWEDMGNYTCTVKNKYGKDSVQTFLYPAKKQ